MKQTNEQIEQIEAIEAVMTDTHNKEQYWMLMTLFWVDEKHPRKVINFGFPFPSVTLLQNLIHVAEVELLFLDVPINATKSVCIRPSNKIVSTDQG
jgi:hypothetical protein